MNPIPNALRSGAPSIQLLSTAMLAALLAPAVSAQDSETGGENLKTVQMIRSEFRPVIDGRLDEEVWSSAVIVEDFHQVQPNEYAQPAEPTIVYLFHDNEALYVGARLWESDPDAVTANVLRQGEIFYNDDHFGVILDPFNNGRSGYIFATNPNAVRVSGLFRNVTESQLDWKGIFDVETTLDNEGWVVEMEIPFKTLSFDPSSDTWGFNLLRVNRGRDERVGWMSRNRTQDPSVSGRAVGFSGLNQGLGLDIVPSVSLIRNRSLASSPWESDTDPSLDLFYKVTPALNGALTFNTDFSATEVDDRQVNLTRFDLVFPEKRNFFLQDLDIFEFGRIGSQRFDTGNAAVTAADRENGRPFFSRSIGLSATGTPVALKYGGKLSGRVGPWNVGAVAINQDEFGDLNSTDLFVGRVTANVLAESSVGFMVTSGDPGSNLDNNVVGADFQYQNTRLPGGQTLRAEGWYQRSGTAGGIGDDSAFGLGVGMPNNTGFRWNLGVKEIEAAFKPALGFVSRPGVRSDTLQIGYTHRRPSGYVQSIYGGVDAHRIERLDGGLESQVVAWRPVELRTRANDLLQLYYLANREVLLQPFEISPGVVIAPGDYAFNESELKVEAAGFRDVAGSFVYRSGEFYAGERLSLQGSLTWRPSRHFRATASYQVDDVELPEGDFTTKLFSLRLDTVFSSTLSWVNLLQYDNVSEVASVNSRLHWVPEAGKDVYLVFNHNLEDFDNDNRFRSSLSDVRIKANYTFRF